MSVCTETSLRVCCCFLFRSDPRGRRSQVLAGLRVLLARIGEPLTCLLPVLLGFALAHGEAVHRQGDARPQPRLGLPDFQLNLSSGKEKVMLSNCLVSQQDVGSCSNRKSWSESYWVLHSGSFFTEAFSFLPAHLLQHLPSFVHFADLPVRTTSNMTTSRLCFFSFLFLGWRQTKRPTDGRRRERRLAGKLPRCPPSAAETRLGLCTLSFSASCRPRTRCSARTQSTKRHPPHRESSDRSSREAAGDAHLQAVLGLHLLQLLLPQSLLVFFGGRRA